jgi:hypothetical protein
VADAAVEQPGSATTTHANTAETADSFTSLRTSI